VESELRYLAALLKLSTRHMVVLRVPEVRRRFPNTDAIETQRIPALAGKPAGD
jgi:hypothetical protein